METTSPAPALLPGNGVLMDGFTRRRIRTSGTEIEVNGAQHV